MKKQPHITEQTKNNLRIAFWSLYAQKPIEKISIKEITELAAAPFISTIMMYMIFFIRLRKKSSGKLQMF